MEDFLSRYASTPSDLTGNVLEDFDIFLAGGSTLIVLPLARVEVGMHGTIGYPYPTVIYPPRSVRLSYLKLKPNSKDARSISELASASTEIDQDVFDSHHLAVFPAKISWEKVIQGSHEGHLALIRALSDHVERRCFDFARYKLCEVGLVDDVPCRPGMVASNPMHSAAWIYNPTEHASRIIAGAAFSSRPTKGLGLNLAPIDWALFPSDGEVGRIVSHGLRLYTSMLEANDETSRFVQCMSLLEYLAFPDAYRQFKDVRKVVARLKATTREEYRFLSERFIELTSKEDPLTKKKIGYRTRVVHIGERIEDILPSQKQVRELFTELATYIRVLMEHMIMHSKMNLEEYYALRSGLPSPA